MGLFFLLLSQKLIDIVTIKFICNWRIWFFVTARWVYSANHVIRLLIRQRFHCVVKFHVLFIHSLVIVVGVIWRWVYPSLTSPHRNYLAILILQLLSVGSRVIIFIPWSLVIHYLTLLPLHRWDILRFRFGGHRLILQGIKIFQFLLFYIGEGYPLPLQPSQTNFSGKVPKLKVRNHIVCVKFITIRVVFSNKMWIDFFILLKAVIV